MASEFLSTKNLTKKFEGLIAVNGVDMYVNEGETVGLIGPNGSGKTTFFNLVSGLFPPTKGTIIFQGNDITSKSPEQRVNAGIARTFQLVSVAENLKVWENIFLSVYQSYKKASGCSLTKASRQTEVMQECEKALKLVGLENIAEDRTSALSYGMKRMLEIAMALSLKPKLLLLDEPFAGLSDEEIKHVSALLHKLKKEFTLIVVEHKITPLLDLVERLIVMNEGSFICSGLPHEVINNPQVKECYFGKGIEDEISVKGEG